MKRRPSCRQADFSPLRDKTLFTVLRQLFSDQFGYGDKMIFAEAMIERILATIDAFVVPHTLLQPGQLLWMAVAYDGRKHVMQHMREIPQVPVVLDLITDQELQELSAGTPFPVIRRQRHARLLQQSFEQGGVLAHTDLAAISLRDRHTVYEDLKAVRQDEGCILPYRGVLEDTGATTSHKVEVVRLLEAGYLEPEICRLLTPTHSLSSVENYAQAYKNVIKLVDRGFAPEEISGILSLGMRTVTAYIAAVKKHHPEIVANNVHLRN
jgi:hypothetical protein